MPRSYSDRTLKLLWGRAAGRCAMPNCRTELFVDDSEYDPIVIIGEIAHAIGISNKGPRANRLMSNVEKNNYDNLILLCKNCHAQIDGQPGKYSVERLKDIKEAHEAWVRASLPERGKSSTGWTLISIQGNRVVDLTTAEEALSPDFISYRVKEIRIASDINNWNEIDREISVIVNNLMDAGDNYDKRFAVFPLAPVSACISLGYHLTNRPNVRLFQYHRDDHTWVWPRCNIPEYDITVSGLDIADKNCRAVAFLFHYSSSIDCESINDIGVSIERFIHFRVPRPSTTWLKHPEQIKWAAIEARQAFERANQLFPKADKWHLFYSGPAPLAVAIGQQINPTMCPKVQLYEYKHKEKPPYCSSILLE